MRDAGQRGYARRRHSQTRFHSLGKCDNRSAGKAMQNSRKLDSGASSSHSPAFESEKPVDPPVSIDCLLVGWIKRLDVFWLNTCYAKVKNPVVDAAAVVPGRTH